MPSFSSFHLEMLWGVRLLPPENQITTSKTERGVPIKSKMRLGALIFPSVRVADTLVSESNLYCRRRRIKSMQALTAQRNGNMCNQGH